MPGVTAPDPLPSGDTLSISAGDPKRFVGGSFSNQGHVKWISDGLQGGDGAALLNSGLWESLGDSTNFSHTFGDRPTLTNTGTLRKSAGVGSMAVSGWIFVNNAGTVDARSGTIAFTSVGASFDNNSKFSGAGVVSIGADASFGGMFMSDNLVLAAGTLTGRSAHFASGVAVANGIASWTGGDLAGSWQIGAGNTLTASGSADKRQAGGNIVNNGSVLWTSEAGFQGGNDGVFTNNGLFEAQASASLAHTFGTRNTFTNTASGVVRASNGATLTARGLALVSAGGEFDATTGSALVYASGMARFNDGTRFTGAGTHVVSHDARFVGTFHSGNLSFAGGTQSGGDGVTAGSKALLQGTLGWTGGDLQGSWEIKAGSTLTVTGPAAKRQVGGSIVNNGAVLWNTEAAFQGGDGGTFVNNGLFDVSTNADFVHNVGTRNAFVNNGRFVKSAGSGDTSLLGPTFSNTGVVDVRSGTILLPGDFVNAGTLMGTGAFGFEGTLRNAGRIAPGASVGILTLNGNLVQTTTGIFEVELTLHDSHDMLRVIGNVLLGGTLALQCFGACSMQVGEEIVLIEATGQLQGAFANITLAGFASGAFVPIYDRLDARVLLQVTEAVVAIPEPQTYALMLVGLGLVAGMASRRRRRSTARL